MQVAQLSVPKSPDARIGERVHMFMWRAGIKQKEMGDAIGVRQTVLSKKLRGSVRWFAGEVERASQVLGVPIADLYGLDDDPRPLLPRLDSNQQPSDSSAEHVEGSTCTVLKFPGGLESGPGGPMRKAE